MYEKHIRKAYKMMMMMRKVKKKLLAEAVDVLDEYEIMMKWVAGVWILCFNEYITLKFEENSECSFYSLEERKETFIVVAFLNT